MLGARPQSQDEMTNSSTLVPFARWLPDHPGMRIFDTRFFLARAPDDSAPVVDATETVRLVWTSAAAMLADAATKGELEKRFICRTFSDCTTAPRNGMISGCFPLDTHYKKSPQMAQLTLIKQAAKLA